jgi:hypothetical protein
VALPIFPEEIKRDSPWMSFEASYRAEGRKLIFKQKLQIKKRDIPENDYPAFKTFFQGLAKSLKQRAVLERKK